LKNQKEAQKYSLSSIKREGMNWTICREILGSSSHQFLMDKRRREKRLKHGLLELGSIFIYIITPQTLKKQFSFTIVKGKLLYGETN